MALNKVRLAYGPGEWHFGDLYLPAGTGPHPVVVSVHGGFWRAHRGLENNEALAVDLTRRGYATWNIEYSRVSQAGGGYPGTLLDVAAALDHLRVLAERYPLDLDRVVAVGHSAGGQLALWLAGRHRIPATSLPASVDPLPLRGVVSLAGANDLRLMWEVRQEESPVANFLGGRPDEVPERYAVASPAELLPLGVPQVLVHGTADQVVPPVLSTAYAVAARAAGDRVEEVILPGRDHSQVAQPESEAWPAVVAAVQRLLPL